MFKHCKGIEHSFEVQPRWTVDRLSGYFSPVLTWGELSAERPDLIERGKALLYQYGVGLTFLATTGADGAPRVHPICPLITAEHLYAFVIPSPKQRDLLRDGRCGSTSSTRHPVRVHDAYLPPYSNHSARRPKAAQDCLAYPG
jgi:hypothetical protein